MTIKLNKLGLNILISVEGFSPKPYICPAGIPTIGIGTTHYPNGLAVSMNDKEITMDTAIQYMNHELDDKSKTIENWINKNKLEFNDNQVSSLLCFAYNLGCGPIIDRERSLNQALLKKDEKSIRNAFMLYIKAKKKNILGVWVLRPLSGLIIRRKLEADLFFTKMED